MATTQATKRSYPFTLQLGGKAITFRLMTPDDKEKLARFARKIDEQDVLLMRTDIRQTEVLDDWIQNVQRGRSVTVLAINGKDEIIGYATLHRAPRTWMRHLVEIRLFVLKPLRGTGIGKVLLSEMVQIAQEQGVQRIVVNISREQKHVRQMLERLGFTVEALLTDWIMDHAGRTHDLVIMSHRVEDL